MHHIVRVDVNLVSIFFGILAFSRWGMCILYLDSQGTTVHAYILYSTNKV